MYKCIIACILTCLILPTLGQTWSENFDEVSKLLDQGKREEANALFVIATDSLIIDSSVSVVEKISTLLVAYNITNFKKGREFLLLATELAFANKYEYLFYDEIDKIRDFYHRFSFEDPELYTELKSLAYNYTTIHVPPYAIDTLSEHEFEVKVMLAKAIGIQSQQAVLKTELDGNWYHFEGELKEFNDSFGIYLFDVSRYDDFIGFGNLSLLELTTRIPDFQNSFIEELYLNYHAVFIGNLKEKPQGLALLYCSDYQKIKPIFDAFYVWQISDIYDAYKGDSVLLAKATSGAFKNRTLNDIFATTSYDDLNLFLDFVSDFPGKYMGREFKMSETYATWIINNAPLSFNSITRYFLNANNLDSLVFRFEQDIVEDGLIEFWKERAMFLAKAFKYQDALEVEKLVFLSSEVLGLSEQKNESAMRMADLYQDLNHFQAAKQYRKIARGNLSTAQNTKDMQREMNLVVQYNHTLPYLLEYHPSGRYYYTSSWDGKIKVWDANLNKLIREYRAHSDMIQTMQVKLNGKHLATGDWTGRIKIWEINGSELKEIVSIRNVDDVNEVHFCNADETSLIAYCGRSKKIHLYNWELDKERTIEKHTANVSALCFNDDGTLLYSGGRDSFIYKWPIHLLFDNLDAEINYSHWYKEPGQIFQIDISPNSLFMSAVRSDSIVALWDVKDNRSLGSVGIYMFQSNDRIMYSPTTFDPIDKFFVYTNSNNKLSLVDLANLKISSFNHHMGELVSDIDFHPNGNILALTSYFDSETKFMDLSNFDISKTTNISSNTPKFTSTKAYKINFDKSGKKLLAHLVPPTGPILTSVNLSNGKNELIQDGLYHVSTQNSCQNAFVPWYKTEYPIVIDSTNQKIEYVDDSMTYSNLNYFINTEKEILYTYDLEHSKTLKAYSLRRNETLFEVPLSIGKEDNWKCTMAVSNGEIFVTNQTNKIYRFNSSNGKILKPIKIGFRNKIYEIKQLNNGNLAVESHWSLVLIDGKSKKKIWKYKYRKWENRKDGEQITTYKVSEDQNLLAYASYNYKMSLFDVTKKFKKLLVDSSSNWFINDIAFHPIQKTLAFSNEENKIRLIDYEEDKVLVDLYPQTTGSFIWVNSDNYYWAGKEDLENIAFEIGGKIYPSEQFDVTYNRPDKVLNDVNLGDPSFLDAIVLASQKRLKKGGIQDVDVTSFPNINFKNKASLPVVTNENEIRIKVEAFDFQYQLKKMQVSVNGVLISEIKLKGNEWDSVVSIPLSNGDNAIKVWVENENNLRSLKEGLKIACNYKAKSNLYLFTMSVSAYQDSTYNLNYAVKDGQDLVGLLLQDSLLYDTIIVNTFYNDQVNSSTLSQISKVLNQATVHDQVIMFISGHGLLDNNYDFFFAGHECDFENPARGGIAYFDIEQVLEKTKARKRLLLMDACHSGEVDKDAIFTNDTTVLLANGQKSGVKSYVYRGAKISDDEDESLGLTNSFELMKELFSDFNTNGTQVISAAAGNSYALESKEWENGVFTYSILDGLTTMKADLNNDGEIRISELKKYVSETVFNLTFGQQRPTTREENVEFDFNIWK